MVAYNPEHIVPPDNPHAEWCDYCGEQIRGLFDDDLDDDEVVYLLDGIILHPGPCVVGYAEGLQRRLRGFENKISDMVERGMS